MATDPEGKSQRQVEWEARLRKEFRDDPAVWAHQRYDWIIRRIEEVQKELAEQNKIFFQKAAEGAKKGLVATREWVVICVGVVAIIALASGGFWVGVALVVGVLVVERWLSWSAQNQDYCLDRFRHRFHELLNEQRVPRCSARTKHFSKSAPIASFFRWRFQTTSARQSAQVTLSMSKRSIENTGVLPTITAFTLALVSRRRRNIEKIASYVRQHGVYGNTLRACSRNSKTK